MLTSSGQGVLPEQLCVSPAYSGLVTTMAEAVISFSQLTPVYHLLSESV